MGAERKSAVITDKVKKMTAYHEVGMNLLVGHNALISLLLPQGGHALVALYTEGSMPLHKVTCMPRGHALGIVRCRHGCSSDPFGVDFVFSRDCFLRQADFPRTIAYRYQ